MKKKQLKVNTFHMVHEGSKTGHPGQIYWANDEHNLYLLITTGSSEDNDRHFIKLKHSTGRVKKTFVYRKPLLAKRKDINAKEIKDMSFHMMIINNYQYSKKGTAFYKIH